MILETVSSICSNHLYSRSLKIAVREARTQGSRRPSIVGYLLDWGFGSLPVYFMSLVDNRQVDEDHEVLVDHCFDPWIKIWMTSLSVLSSLSSECTQRWLRGSLLGSSSGRGNTRLRKSSIRGFVCVVYFHRANYSKFWRTFYSQDLLWFDSLLV